MEEELVSVTGKELQIVGPAEYCFLVIQNLTGIITKFKYEKKSENDSRRSSTVYNDAIVQMIHYLPYLLLTKYHHHCFSSFLSM